MKNGRASSLLVEATVTVVHRDGGIVVVVAVSVSSVTSSNDGVGDLVFTAMLHSERLSRAMRKTGRRCLVPRRPLGPSGGLADIISSDTFNQMLKHRDDGACPARGFYTYNSFIQAAGFFPDFATTGDAATRKREVAAFLGQTSHETTSGWATAPDGPYAWGYCFKQ